MRPTLFFVFFASVFFSLIKPASALMLQPAVLDISLHPGATYTGTVSIKNDDVRVQTYFLSVQKFIPKGESGQQDFLPASETSGLPSWIFFQEPSIALKAGEEKRVLFTVRLPFDVPPGGYYAAIFFSDVSPQFAQKGMAIGTRTGALLFLTVEGAPVHRLSVQDFRLVSDVTLAHLPAAFLVSINNQGNIHEVPDGWITIKNFFGSVVTRVPFNEGRGRILPGSTRRFLLNWQRQPTRDGQGFFYQVGEEWRNFAFGPYRAMVELRGSSAEAVAALPVLFFVWPWQLLVCFGLGVVGLLVVFFFYRRWVLYRAIQKK